MNRKVVKHMKKFLMILILTVTLFSLFACQGTKDVEVTIANESITAGNIVVDVIVTEKFETVDQIKEIAYNISSQVYEKNFDTIGSSSYTLTINLYDSESSVTNQIITYGSIIFDINQSLESPGLSLNQNLLTLE